MSNIIAALGLSQLNKLDRMVEMRRKNAHLMSQKLSRVKGVKTPVEPEGLYHVYQMYTIMVPESMRNGLKQHLEEAGIMSKVFFSPVHKTYFYKNELKYRCALPVTEAVSARVLTLPICPSLSAGEINTITDRIAGFFSKAA